MRKINITGFLAFSSSVEVYQEHVRLMKTDAFSFDIHKTPNVSSLDRTQRNLVFCVFKQCLSVLP